jgi:hypothetical protein
MLMLVYYLFLHFERVNISGLHRFFSLLALLKFFTYKTLTKYQSVKAIAAHSGLYMTPKIVFISHPTPPRAKMICFSPPAMSQNLLLAHPFWLFFLFRIYFPFYFNFLFIFFLYHLHTLNAKTSSNFPKYELPICIAIPKKYMPLPTMNDSSFFTVFYGRVHIFFNTLTIFSSFSVTILDLKDFDTFLFYICRTLQQEQPVCVRYRRGHWLSSA